MYCVKCGIQLADTEESVQYAALCREPLWRGDPQQKVCIPKIDTLKYP